MLQQHPITPSIELVKQWSDRWHSAKDNDFDVVLFVAIEAARWGADQELEACCEYLTRCAAWEPWEPEDIQEMRDLRRPKPPSLKQQALEALGPEPMPETGPTGDTILNVGAIERHRFLRRSSTHYKVQQ
jgi:hypothetical protein